jgi:hypothetical protein
VAAARGSSDVSPCLFRRARNPFKVETAGSNPAGVTIALGNASTWFSSPRPGLAEASAYPSRDASASAALGAARTRSLARFMHEDTRWTPKAAAVDSGGTVWALDMPTRRRFAQGASDCHPRALRKDGAVGLDIETSPGVDQA